ncbi:teichuronic acid biosynthesis protein TuaC [Bacillus sp. NPDC077027]|uniref:teichuronic acid biosynthesis protein TuaC n=1 Tax=Bacillus sp. NPDC077027 TaxID=3390548 RepID=UPI003D026337
MKVVWMTSVYPSERNPGEGVFHETQVQELIKLGLEVTVICPTPINPPLLRFLKASYRKKKSIPEVESRRGVTVYRPAYRALPRQLIWAQPSKRMATAVLRVLNQYNLSPDLIHAHFAMPSGGAAAIVSDVTHIPFLLTLHGSDVNVYPHYSKGAMTAFQTAVKKASVVLAVSEELVRKTKEMAQVDCEFIPLGIPLDTFSSGNEGKAHKRKQLGLPSHDKLVVFVGRLVKEKGVLELASAVRQLDGVKAVFIGKGPLEKELSDHNDDSILIIGQVPNEQVKNYLLAADLFVLPSYGEGMPTVVIEALALKVPVIATKVGGLPSLFSQYHDWLIEPRSSVQLKESISSYLHEDRWNESLADDLYEVIQSQFSSTHNAKRLVDQYKNVLNK